MASRDKFDVDMFHKSIQYALEKLGKSKSGFERTVVSKFKRKRRVGSGNELVDYSRAPCLGADQKARGLWERDWALSIWKNSKIAEFFAPLPFLTYLCYKRLKPLTHCVQLRRKIAKIERAWSK